MISPTLRLRPIGSNSKKIDNYKLRVLVALSLICVLVAGAFAFAAEDTKDSFIKYSTKSDRSNPTSLNGATVRGNVYIFLGDVDIISGSYFLDTRGVTTNDLMTSGSKTAPFDFMYRESDGSAKPFDTSTLSEGKHTLIVTTRVETNKYVQHSAEFIVDNVPDVPANPYIRVSNSADRSNPYTLDQSTVSGNIYVHLSDRDLQSAAYFLNTNGNYDNSVMTSGSKTFPFDFKYRERNGDARPFDTRTLADGIHELAVTTRSASTGKYNRHIIKFTVNNSSSTISTSTTTAQTPTTTQAPTTTTTTAPSVFVPSFAGDIAPGKVRWGSSIGGNSDPLTRHPAEIANRMGLRRTFWDMNKTSSLINTAKADLAAGRLPWVSVKLNGSWKDNGDGKYDAQMTALLTQLSALDGPVWFTAHHEPEGGCRTSCAANGMDDIGGPSEWLRMQANTSKLLKQLRAQGKGNNIAFAPILMGWTFQSQSGRTPSEWYQAGIWDFAGIDAYGEGEGTTPFLETNGMAAVRKFYGERGLKVAVGEWGIRNQNHSETSAGEIPTQEEQQNALIRFNSAYTGALGSATDGKGAQVIGLSYFDSALNSPNGSWELTYLQLPRFRELVQAPTSLQAKQNK